MTFLALYKKELGESLFSLRGGSWLLAAVTILSTAALLFVTNEKFNLIDQKGVVLLTCKLAILLGGLVALIQAADAFTGERERQTLEALLLAPLSGQTIVWAKLLSALTAWFLLYAMSLPYLAVMSAGLANFPTTAGSLFLFGTALVGGLAAAAVAISSRLDSGKTAASFALLAALILFGLTFLPPPMLAGGPGKLLDVINPVAGAYHALGKIIVDEQQLATQWPRALAVLVFLCAALAVMTLFGRNVPLSGARS